MVLAHPVLVSGASTGIGRASVAAVVAAGGRVWATVRRSEDADSLLGEYGEAVTPLVLDLTDEGAVRAAAARVVAAGPLAGLVNNAGIAVAAPLEYLPLAALRHQLEVNLVGQLGLTQAVLPAIREGTGRVVAVGSIGGRIAGPLLGAYAASKFGLLGLTDSLRAELAPFGIKVILIEPGRVATPIWATGMRSAEALLADLPDEARRRYAAVIDEVASGAQRSGRDGIPASAVAEVILRALTVRHPRPRYLVGRDAYALSMVARMPHRLRYRIVASR